MINVVKIVTSMNVYNNGGVDKCFAPLRITIFIETSKGSMERTSRDAVITSDKADTVKTCHSRSSNVLHFTLYVSIYDSNMHTRTYRRALLYIYPYIKVNQECRIVTRIKQAACIPSYK